MGRKKKFIDKKKSATFQLLARDSSDLNPLAQPAEDRVFIRVDRNPYATHGFLQGEDEDPDLDHRLDDTDPNSIFADAPGDDSDEGDETPNFPTQKTSAPLPDNVRREILELGLPDDGYNYLLHLREIKNTGGGSSFYHNSKAKLDRVPLDVKVRFCVVHELWIYHSFMNCSTTKLCIVIAGDRVSLHSIFFSNLTTI